MELLLFFLLLFLFPIDLIHFIIAKLTGKEKKYWVTYRMLLFLGTTATWAQIIEEEKERDRVNRLYRQYKEARKQQKDKEAREQQKEYSKKKQDEEPIIYIPLCYKILNAVPSDTDEKIKELYRQRVKQYHPDKYKTGTGKRQAHDIIVKINVAYNEIKQERGMI